jgi:hypothetical protein
MYRLLSIGLLLLAATFIAGTVITGIFLFPVLTLSATIVMIAACVISAVTCCVGSHNFAAKAAAAEQHRTKEDKENKKGISAQHVQEAMCVKAPGCIEVFTHLFFSKKKSGSNESTFSFAEKGEDDDEKVDKVFSDGYGAKEKNNYLTRVRGLFLIRTT